MRAEKRARKAECLRQLRHRKTEEWRNRRPIEWEQYRAQKRYKYEDEHPRTTDRDPADIWDDDGIVSEDDSDWYGWGEQ